MSEAQIIADLKQQLAAKEEQLVIEQAVVSRLASAQNKEAVQIAAKVTPVAGTKPKFQYGKKAPALWKSLKVGDTTFNDEVIGMGIVTDKLPHNGRLKVLIEFKGVTYAVYPSLKKGEGITMGQKIPVVRHTKEETRNVTYGFNTCGKMSYKTIRQKKE